MSSVSCLRCFQNLSEIISGWLALEEERFWARPTSTKVGTELAKVGMMILILDITIPGNLLMSDVVRMSLECL